MLDLMCSMPGGWGGWGWTRKNMFRCFCRFGYGGNHRRPVFATYLEKAKGWVLGQGERERAFSATVPLEPEE